MSSLGDVSKNGGVIKTWENPFIRKAKRTLMKIVKDNLFRTLKINQKLPTIQGMFKKIS